MWRRENSWPYQYSNSDSLGIQPVASRYTDWAIPAVFQTRKLLKRDTNQNTRTVLFLLFCVWISVTDEDYFVVKGCQSKLKDSHRLSDKSFSSCFFTKFFSLTLIWYALERQCWSYKSNVKAESMKLLNLSFCLLCWILACSWQCGNR
jgi:hypothetical protein